MLLGGTVERMITGMVKPCENNKSTHAANNITNELTTGT